MPLVACVCRGTALHRCWEGVQMCQVCYGRQPTWASLFADSASCCRGPKQTYGVTSVMFCLGHVLHLVLILKMRLKPHRISRGAEESIAACFISCLGYSPAVEYHAGKACVVSISTCPRGMLWTDRCPGFACICSAQAGPHGSGLAPPNLPEKAYQSIPLICHFQ